MRATDRVVATVIAVGVWVFAGFAIASSPWVARSAVTLPLAAAASCTPAAPH